MEKNSRNMGGFALPGFSICPEAKDPPKKSYVDHLLPGADRKVTAVEDQ